MSLIPCPECKAEISSRANFCPKCGYPFREISKHEKKKSNTVVVRAVRPFGILLGVAMCVIGGLLLSSRFVLMLPFYFRTVSESLDWPLHREYFPIWRFIWASPWQFFGLVLLFLGIVQLIFGSTKLKKEKPIVY
ncbi:MAG: zinc ribbon domain-containing protein [Candidatus Hodarchaeota archaeon]